MTPEEKDGQWVSLGIIQNHVNIMRRRLDHPAPHLTMAQLVADAHDDAKAKGFHDGPVDIPKWLALVHSEVSEALEMARLCPNFTALNYTMIVGGKPEGFAYELADVVIRVADICGRLGIDLEDAIKTKMKYNETRPHMHGGKAF